MKRFFVVLLFLTASNSWSLGWSDWTTITEIQTGTGGHPIFYLDEAGDALTGCDNGLYIRMDSVDDSELNPGGSRSFSTVLAAFMAGKEVKVKTDKCEFGDPAFRTMRVRN